jgi:hypothetical protein
MSYLWGLFLAGLLGYVVGRVVKPKTGPRRTRGRWDQWD